MKILVCGMNGAGKSTLGRVLAARLGLAFRDAEDYWFPKDGAYLYERPRTEAEADALLRQDLRRLDGIVYAAVRCRAVDVLAEFDCAVYVDVPKEVRMARVRQRSYGKFGERMRPGGDLHDAEERFFAQCAARPQEFVEDWLETTGLPVIRVDGMRPTEALAETVVLALKERNFV